MVANEVSSEQKKLYGFAAKLILEFFVFLIFLVALGYFIHAKMETLMNEELEKVVAERAYDVSAVMGAKFSSERLRLQSAAVAIEKGTSPEAVISSISGKGNDEAGLVALDGSVVAGASMMRSNSQQLGLSFQGATVTTYYRGFGIIISVPVYDGENIKYVLYSRYNDITLFNLFSKGKMEKDAVVFICNRRTGEIVMSYDDSAHGDAFYDDKNDIPALFDEMRAGIVNNDATAKYHGELADGNFVYGADIKDTPFMLVGYIPWNKVAADIMSIHYIVLWVFGLLLLFFSIFTLYSFTAALKAAESDELREARDEAERANKAKSDFLANMSHEIRTPINAVLGMDEMILRETAEEGTRKYAWNIKSAGETLLSLINDILDFSKIESGKMELVESQYSLSSVLNDVVNMVHYKANQKGLGFHIEVDKTLPDSLFGDEVRIKQVIVNILNNAVKYTPEGSVTFKVAGEKLDDEMLELRLSSIDTGIGIKEEDKEKLFSNFERLDLQKNRNIEGTGLGLSITLSLVRMMGGEVKVDSVYGEGSTFTVSIPQRIESPAPIGDFTRRVEEAAHDCRAHHDTFTAPDAKVLVVDDNEMNLFVVESLLKRTKVQITSCGSGFDCLEMLKKEKFDIVFLDHMMPDIDGIETLHRALDMGGEVARTPFVALTANAIAGVRDMFLSEGFTDYLAKPIDSHALERMLMHYLPSEKVNVIPAGSATEEEADDAGEEKTAPQGDTEDKEPMDNASETANDYGGGTEIDVATGMQYSGDMEEMYHEFLKMFCARREATLEKIEGAYNDGDWENYTTFVHALKSTALSVGGVRLSEEAKAIEAAGHAILDGPAEEKEEKIAFIREHHENLSAMYEAFHEEAKKRFPEVVE